MPTTQERVARLLLRIQTEKSAITQAKKDLQGFQKDFKDFKAESERVNRALEQQAHDLQKQQRAALQAGRETDRLSKEQRDLAQDVEKTTTAIKRQSDAVGKVGGGDRRNLLQRVGSEVRALPAVPLGGNLSTDVIGKLVNTLGGLGTAGTAAALGIGAAIVALKASTAGIETTVKSIIATQEEFYRALATGTRDSIRAQIEAKKIEIEIKRDQVEESRRVFTQLEAQVGGVGRAISDVLDLGGSRQFREELQKNEQELRDLQFGVGRLEQALNSTEVATNTAVEAEKKLKEAREAIADARVSAQIAAELSVRKQDAESIRERIAVINQELALNLEYAQSADISNEKVAQLTQRSRDLAVELQVLSDALPEKERIEAAREAFDKIKEGINSFIKDTAKNFKDLQEVSKEIGELRADFKQRIFDIQNKLAEQLAEADRDRNMARAEAQRDADIAQSEAIREAGLERAEIERESQLAVQRILRRSKVDINNAIQDRDAVALDAARARKKEELATEAGNLKERLRQIDIGLKEELRTIDRRLKEQNRTIDIRYAEQVRRAQMAAQKSIEIETAKFNKELALKQQEAAKLLQLQQQTIATTINGANQVLGINMTFWQNMATIGRNALAALGSNGAQVQKFGSGGSNNIITKFLKGITGLDTGGRILTDGLVYAHAGETVINPRRGQRGGGGDIIFAPQINGMNKVQIKRELTRQLDRFVEENF